MKTSLSGVRRRCANCLHYALKDVVLFEYDVVSVDNQSARVEATYPPHMSSFKDVGIRLSIDTATPLRKKKQTNLAQYACVG